MASNNTITPRNNTITYMKGLCIMLMVLVHARCAAPRLIVFLCMFLMPLFFIVSGFCLKEKYLDDPKTFFTRRVKTIYWQYAKMGVIFALLHNVFYALHLYDENYGYCIPQHSLLEILDDIQTIVFQMRVASQLLGGYWFLNALFFGSAIAWVMLRYIRRVEYCLPVSLLTLLVVHLTNFHVVFLNLNTRAFVVAVLIISGYALARLRARPFNILMVALTAVLTYIGTDYWVIEIDQTEYDDLKMFPYILTAVMCTWSLYSLFVKWTETESMASRFMRFVGENTMTILTWHMLGLKLVSLIIILVYGLDIRRLAELPVIEEYAFKGWWVAYFTISMAFCFAIVRLKQCINIPTIKLPFRKS